MMFGNLFTVMREFLENTNIPDWWRYGLNTSDWDWDDMAHYDDGNIQLMTVITEPTNWLDMVLAHMRLLGLQPGIGASGKLSVRRLAAPAYNYSLGTIDSAYLRDDRWPELTPTDGQVVTGVKYDVGLHGGRLGRRRPFNIPNRTLQARFGKQNTLEFTAETAWDVSNNDFAGHATQIFQTFKGDALVGRLPCTVRAGVLLPGDNVAVTSEVIPDATDGTRGVSEVLALVTGIDVQPYSNTCDVHVYISADAAQRGGWAPAAWVTDYVDNGGGAAAGTQHELILSVTNYTDGDTVENLPCSHSNVANNEGHFFPSGASCRFFDWDTLSPTSNTVVVSSPPHNSTGSGVYVTTATAPTAASGVSGSMLMLGPYTSGVTLSQRFVHVCDEATGLIGGGDQGFKPV
jgi:hypothetical protein